MDTVLLLTALIIILVSYTIFSKLRGLLDIKDGLPIPGPKPLPLIGNSLDIDTQRIHHGFAKMAKWYGAIFKVKMFGENVVVINDSKILKEMLANTPHGHVFNNRPGNVYAKYLAFNNQSLVFGQANPTTFAMRKMYLNALKDYGDGNEHFENTMENLLKLFLQEIKATDAYEFDIARCLRKSFGTATSSFLTGRPAAETDWTLIYKFIDTVNVIETPGYSFVYRFLPVVKLLPGKLGSIFRLAKETSNALLERFFFSVKDRLKQHVDLPTGFVAALLRLREEENRKHDAELITEVNVKAMVLDTFFAATETTAMALINSFALFIAYDDVVKKIQAEIDNVIGNGRLPKTSDKNNMPYLMATVWEILRYTSYVPLAIPHKVAKNYKFHGYFIPKDTILFANVWYIQHDPIIWNDPWEFRPERFLDSDGKLISPDHKYMQNVLLFSTGQRKCLGEAIGINRIFLYIASLLQSYNVKPAVSGELPDTDPRNYKPGSVIVVKDYKCRAVPRNKVHLN